MTEHEILEVLSDDATSAADRLREASRGLKRYPKSAALWCAFGNLIQLSDDDSQYELDDAKKAYVTALELDGDNAEALEGLGAYFDEVDDDPAGAEVHLRRAVEMGGGEDAYALLARVLTELGRKGEALEQLSSARCPFADTDVVVQTLKEIREGVWGPEPSE